MKRIVFDRLLEIVLTMLAVSLLVYLVLEADKGDVATKVLGRFSTEAQRAMWLEANGYNRTFFVRYFEWLGRFVTGDWGMSTHFRAPVTDLVLPRLGSTGILAAITLAVTVPLALVLGILAGAREGSKTDRVISVFSIFTTSVPEFASAVFLSGIFVFWLGWLPGASSMTSGFAPRELILPVMVLTLYTTGYLARITRASMAEAMATLYVRTARMKGASFRRIVLKHALRNALVAPVTVIMLQVPWLVSGVIVVEVFFAYKGFGSLLYEAGLYSDIALIEACTMIGVLVVVATQLVSDALYLLLNPRMRRQTTETPEPAPRALAATPALRTEVLP